MHWNNNVRLLLGIIVAISLTGCPPKKKKIAPKEEVEAPVETLEKEVVIGAEWGQPGSLESVYFLADRSELSSDSRTVLKQNAALLKAILEQAPNVQVRVEGHCDERNTLEYNLALGQRRAKAVQDYYRALGIRKTEAISYGEERPRCSGRDENCWWQNRRGDTTLRSMSGEIRIPKEKLR